MDNHHGSAVRRFPGLPELLPAGLLFRGITGLASPKRGHSSLAGRENLNPGVFWERDLFASLEAASCVVVVASADSMKSPNCRQEWSRAVSLGKRIIIVRFRGAKLPDELCSCEVVDFRGAFGPALRNLMARLRAEPPPTLAAKAPSPALPRVPSWVLGVLIFSLVPMLVELMLVDWSGGPSSRVLNVIMILLFALGSCWLMSFSFLQRKMGMTRLATSLVLLAFLLALPLAEYIYYGPAGLAGEAEGIARAVTKHPLLMALIAGVPLLGLALIVVFRPYDLLRWTPTGKAWHWYRRRCAAKVFAEGSLIPAPQARSFFLIHDAADNSASEFIRQRLAKVGWAQSTDPGGSTSVLLLTNRTTRNWLLQQQIQLSADVLTIVATTICLPAQLEWLWKREWVDLRGWKMERLHSAAALPQVPEGVTTPHFPAVVKFANHFICCLAGLAFTLTMVAVPGVFDAQSTSGLTQTAIAYAALGVTVACFEIARRILRRTITKAWFYWGAWAGWCCELALLLYVSHQGLLPADWSRSIWAVVFLTLFPIALQQTGTRLAFWFPDETTKSDRRLPTLAGKMSWRTFWCFCLYLMAWIFCFSTSPGLNTMLNR
jgi:hypothetical protein